MQNNGVIGISFTVIDDGEVDWSKGYDYANLNSGDTTTAATPFGVASISKTVTGVAVMQLVEDGQIDLDEDINQYLPFNVASLDSDGTIPPCI